MNTRVPSRLGRRAGARGAGDQPAPEVYRITSAADSLSEDQSRRVKRYLVQMAIRMACFIGAVFADGILMWVLLAAAVLLPYIAVVEANSGRDRRDDDLPPIDYRRQLPGPSGSSAPTPSATHPAGAHHG